MSSTQNDRVDDSMNWHPDRMDRMEGSIKGKNLPSIMKVGKDQTTYQNTGEKIPDR